jgi:SIR2-like domain
MPVDLDAHFEAILPALRHGELVPFLGAGANLVDRKAGDSFDPALRDTLPTGSELARYLASVYELEGHINRSDDLLRVAERIKVRQGEMAVYNRLSELLDADYPVTALHELIASLPGRLRDRGWKPLQLIVTTNYDDLLERAFRAAGEEVDVLAYIAAGRGQEGQFRHYPPSGDPRLIPYGMANEYPLELRDDGYLRRPAILKLHGTVDRGGHGRDSYVISEDDYIDYLARVDLERVVPTKIRTVLARSAFLFLGYSLRDWNVRAILREIWDTVPDTKGWAIQLNPTPQDTDSWKHKNVDIVPLQLELYVAALVARLGEPGAGAQPGG